MPDAHLGDEPTELDLLGFTPLVENLSTLILEMKIRDTPLCVGVYGEWGSGKTSFLKMVTKNIRDSGQIQSIWFNAWKYDREENLWAALLQSVFVGSIAQGTIRQRAVVKWKLFWNSLDLREGIWINVRRITPPLIRIGVIVLLVGIALLAKDPAYQSLIQTIAQQFQVGGGGVRTLLAGVILSVGGSTEIWSLANAPLGFDLDAMWKKPSYKQHIAFLDKFQDELRRLIELVSRGRPICIVIDDLDRCLPEKAISVLEAIKQFLDVPGCVFLVALDQELLERAVTVKFRELVRDGDDQLRRVDQAKFASSYVEKIVQLPISLPVSHTDRTVLFIKSLFAGRDTSAWDEIFALGLSRNPRRIKRALRVFQFLELGATAQVHAVALRHSLLAKLIVIQHEARGIFFEISTRPELLVAMEEVARGVEVPDAGERVALMSMAADRLIGAPSLRRMLSLSPDEQALTDDLVTAHLNFMMQTLEPSASAPASVRGANSSIWRQYASVLARRGHLGQQVFVEPLLRPVRVVNPETRSTQRQTLPELVKTSMRVLLVGAAGMGKTTALSSVVASIASDYANSEADQSSTPARGKLANERLIPIVIKGRELRLRRDLWTACLAEVQGQVSTDLTSEALSELISTGGAIIFLDEYDSLTVIERDDAIRQLSSLFGRYPALRAVISTRPLIDMPDQALGWDVFEIQPFSVEQRRALVARYASEGQLSDDTLTRFDKLLSSPGLVQLSSVPLFVWMLLEVILHAGEVPAERVKALSTITDLLLFRRDQSKGLSPAVELSTSKVILAQLAFRLAVRDEHAFGISDIEAVCVELGMGEHSLSKITQHLLERTGLLVSDSIGEFHFDHRVIEEYFAAEGLLRELMRSLDFVDTLEMRWVEVLGLAFEIAESEFVGKVLDRMVQTSNGLEVFSEVVPHAGGIGMKRTSDLREKLQALERSEETRKLASRALEALNRSVSRENGRPN